VTTVIFVIASFLLTANSVQKIKTENTLDQHVLKVDIKTEVEEDSAVNPEPSHRMDSGMNM
jgi:hypothetical protein